MDAASPVTHRTIAVVGGSGSGKTTLIEALLHRAGAIARKGSIELGTTVCDHEPEEIARHTTLGLSLAYLTWTTEEETVGALTLVDAPGHPDFAGALDTALSIADLALVAVSAVDGVSAGTKAAWAAAEAAAVPRMIVVTQEDRARADFRRVLQQLRDTFGGHVLPIELPVGEEADFHGIADILSEHALVYDDAGRHHEEAIPPDLAEEEHRLHQDATEEIVSHDDAQLEAYLDGTEPTARALERTLAKEVAAGAAIPVLLCSAYSETGIDRVADLLLELAPAPGDRDGRIVIGVDAEGDGGSSHAVSTDASGDTLVHVFHTVADPFVGQIAMIKVLSGVLRPGDRLHNATTGAEERMPALFRLRGSEHLPADALRAGDVGAVAKLAGSPSGSLLWTRAQTGARPRRHPLRHPVYAVALEPVSQSDDTKLSTALARLVADDPTLVVDRTGNATILRGLGDTHVAVAVERLARVLGVHVTTSAAPVAFRETIAGPAEAEGKLKKQSGGHGQFADVHLLVSPLAAGGGFEFVDATVGGSVPKAYVPAVERGAREAFAAGGPQGHPVIDVRVELRGGKAHSVDSSEMAFRTAASLGVKAALAQAGTVLLEPVSAVTVTVPNHLQGPVLTDLSGRRGRVSGTETTDDGAARILATVPDAELAHYVVDLRSLTGGEAELTIVPDRYERAPHGAGG